MTAAAPVLGMSWHADCGQDLTCRRCLIPGRGWAWDGLLWCEPCHRHHRGDEQTDELILSDHSSFGEWWTDDLLTRTAAYPVAEPVKVHL